ncbi:MAG: CopG family ribbon-helix-helix protein [Infirmifilum uzonense]|uniref:CopG family ribbon-helix-helix protein n=1 Tax=Infirmifilum uzonense TaxID=1550241 RepID=UPI003C7383A4
MSTKARFGVSIDEKLAQEVEKLVQATETNRSHIVNLALREFLNGKFHFMTPHTCEGVLILSYEPQMSDKIDRTLEDNKDMILSILHIHSSEGKCIEVIYTRAQSERILELENGLQKSGCKTCKFVPCHS